MADEKTERARALTTDLDGVRKQWWDDGFAAGQKAERARIQAVEEQGSALPGHEALVAKLKFDGKTTGPEAAVQIIAAERKKRDAANNNLMDADPKLPGEFASLRQYRKFCKEVRAGRILVLDNNPQRKVN